MFRHVKFYNTTEGLQIVENKQQRLLKKGYFQGLVVSENETWYGRLVHIVLTTPVKITHSSVSFKEGKYRTSPGDFLPGDIVKVEIHEKVKENSGDVYDVYEDCV